MSHIWSLICFPSMLIMRAPNSTPVCPMCVVSASVVSLGVRGRSARTNAVMCVYRQPSVVSLGEIGCSGSSRGRGDRLGAAISPQTRTQPSAIPFQDQSSLLPINQSINPARDDDCISATAATDRW